ncbi:hypothetical protein QVA66_03890 [Staphylococcus chromogenes]|nr:hypothetical protein [Staphylococcus chromogenes]
MPGPPPKMDGTNRSKSAMNYVLAELPPDGRKGRAPKWPLPGRAPRGWAELWKTPQAVMWEKLGSELSVARYLLLRVSMERLVAEHKEVRSALFSEIRQSEDSLGLSPKGMQTLRWRIASDEVQEKRQEKTASTRRRQMRVVAEEMG